MKVRAEWVATGGTYTMYSPYDEWSADSNCGSAPTQWMSIGFAVPLGPAADVFVSPDRVLVPLASAKNHKSAVWTANYEGHPSGAAWIVAFRMACPNVVSGNPGDSTVRDFDPATAPTVPSRDGRPVVLDGIRYG